MRTYYAMIGGVGYERESAVNDEHARREIAVRLLRAGAVGLLNRWMRHGARVERALWQSRKEKDL